MGTFQVLPERLCRSPPVNVAGKEIDVEAGGAEHIDDGRADAGGVHGKRAVAGEFIMLDDFADTIDDAGVRGAEGQAFDMEKLKTVKRALVRTQGDEALDEGDGSRIVFLAEIDTYEPVHSLRAFRLGSMAASMRSRLK